MSLGWAGERTGDAAVLLGLLPRFLCLLGVNGFGVVGKVSGELLATGVGCWVVVDGFELG